MKDILVVFDSHYFVRAVLLIALAIASDGRNNYFSNQNCFAAAFCNNVNVRNSVKSISIGGRNLRHASSISAVRGNNINEWVSYLEEEFNRSGDDGDNNNSPDNDYIRPDPKQRAFQTSVTTHTNVIDFLDQIDTAPPNDLTVVLFFAHYCKTCHRAIVPFKQLANNSAQGVRFVRFETSALSPKKFVSLGIDRIPFLQIYRNGICVASFSATQKTSRTSRKIVLRPRVLEHIDECQRRSLTDWLAFRDRHDSEIEANKAARANIRHAIDAQNVINNDNDDDDDDEDDDEERLYQSVQTLTSESDLLCLLRGGKESGMNRAQSRGDDDYRKGRGENSIVVVMFHSHFDSSCLRAQHKFRKIAREYQQQQQQQKEHHRTTPSFTMARIEASILPDNSLQSLGIQRYPHIQIYVNSGDSSHKDEGNTETKQCVASFSIPRAFLFARMLHEALDVIDQRTPEEWTEFYDQHRKEIESKQLALEGIIRERQQQQQL